MQKLFELDLENEIFERLPTCEKCCFCIFLEPGCILACLFNMCSGLSHMSAASAYGDTTQAQAPCHLPVTKACNLKYILYILAYIDCVFGVVIFIASIFCIIGIFTKNLRKLSVYNTVLFIFIVALVAESLLIALVRTVGVNCTIRAFELAICLNSTVLMSFVYFHFLMVINSHLRALKHEVMERQQLPTPVH